jgi:hypothetical protein
MVGQVLNNTLTGKVNCCFKFFSAGGLTAGNKKPVAAVTGSINI